MSDITGVQARACMDAALAKCKELDVKMNVCVVDSGANLKAHEWTGLG